MTVASIAAVVAVVAVGVVVTVAVVAAVIDAWLGRGLMFDGEIATQQRMRI